MNIEKQCCNLEQAKRLKELGVNVRCAFGYIEIPENGLSVHWYWRDDKYALINANIVMYVGNGDQRWYAPTVAELGETLPAGYDTMKITVVQNEYTWQGYDYDGKDCPDGTFETEAQCRAAMLIHLIENKLITVQEINTRLMAG